MVYFLIETCFFLPIKADCSHALKVVIIDLNFGNSVRIFRWKQNMDRILILFILNGNESDLKLFSSFQFSIINVIFPAFKNPWKVIAETTSLVNLWFTENSIFKISWCLYSQNVS